jgi:hypothetical protein
MFSPGEQSAASGAISAEWNAARNEQATTAFSSAIQSWPDSVGDRLAKLLKLPPDWDGHVGRPISRTIVDYACALLPRLVRPGIPPPFIAPLASGGLQLEWHRNGWDLEIEIEGAGRLYVYARELATDQEWEADLTDNLSELQPKLDAIAD